MPPPPHHRPFHHRQQEGGPAEAVRAATSTAVEEEALWYGKSPDRDSPVSSPHVGVKMKVHGGSDAYDILERVIISEEEAAIEREKEARRNKTRERLTLSQIVEKERAARELVAEKEARYRKMAPTAAALLRSGTGTLIEAHRKERRDTGQRDDTQSNVSAIRRSILPFRHSSDTLTYQ